jgi:hypothetical protein
VTTPPSVTFRGTLELFGKTAAGVVVPAELVTELGRGKRPPVTVTINGGYTYATTIAPMGGHFLVGVAAEHCGRAHIAAGDELSYTNRKEIAAGIESAKKPETRAKRIGAAIDRLR